MNLKIIYLYLYYYFILKVVPVSLTKTTKSLYEMANDYEDDKNSVIAIHEKESEDIYDEFYAERDIDYKQESSMDTLFFGPPETFMRLDAETILHILSNIRQKHLIPINKVLQAWDLITDGKTAVFLQGREYLSFGYLLNYVPEEDLYYTNMGDESVRKYFAEYSEGLQFRKFGILVNSYKRYYGNTWFLNASSINQLGYLICGFPPSDLKKISFSAMRELKHDVLGKLKRCNEEQVQALYDIAIHPDVFGEPYKWTSHEIARLSTLLKCIPANELSSIQLEAMPAISEEVIAEFSQYKLTKFTKQQVMKMNPLTRRIYILRIQLQSSLDVNDVTKHSYSSRVYKPILFTFTLIVIFAYFRLLE